MFFERDSVEIKYSEDSNTFLEDYYLLKPDIILVNSYKFSNEVINYIRDQANDSDVYILVILDESELEKKGRSFKPGSR